MTQNNLGTALTSLGQRESGTVRLEEAVVAYREALKEYTRERVPLDWARTQNNLGLACLGCDPEQSRDCAMEARRNAVSGEGLSSLASIVAPCPHPPR